MFRGTISIRSKARTTGFTVPQNYTLFVFDEALAIAPLGSHGKLLGLAGAAGHHVGQVVNVVGKRIEKKQRAAQEQMIGEFPADLTVQQVIDHVDDAHSVSIGEIESLEVATAAYPPGQMRGANLHFTFASRDVDPFIRKRLYKEKQYVSSDPGPAVELLIDVLKDKVRDKRRIWGKR